MKKRAFVSVDMEGLPYITSNEHMSPGKLLYDEARSIMTECVLAMADELHNSGFEIVVVADSHGPKVNLIPEKMPGFVEVVRGNPEVHFDGRGRQRLRCCHVSGVPRQTGYA